jgi:hypothetical protein
VQSLISMLGLTLSYPIKKGHAEAQSDKEQVSRADLLDNPDIALAASVVLATKYMYPFDKVERFPRNEDDPLTMKMNWQVWAQAFEKASNRVVRRNFEKLEPAQVWSLDDEEIDQYLDWYQGTQIVPEGKLPVPFPWFAHANCNQTRRDLQDLQESFPWTLLPKRHDHGTMSFPSTRLGHAWRKS